MQINDETLMALADNELDPETAARVSQAVSADPALAARLDRFTRTRRLLSDSAHAQQSAAPSEDPLAAMIRAGVSRPAAPPASANLNRRPILAAAASLAIAAMGLAWWSWSVRVPDGLSVPELAALDGLPSGQSQSLGDGGDLTMIASFHAGSGALCREFETAEGERIRIVLACQDAKGWHQRFTAVTEGQGGSYQPASGEGTIDEALAQIGASAPLTAAEEAAALTGKPPG